MSPDRVRLAAMVSPLLLAGVALFGVWQHATHDQSSWSGASFGMFATVDGESTRQVRAYVEDDGDRAPLALPEDLDPDAFEARVLPTPGRLVELGEQWAEEAGLEPGRVLVVEVWGVEFDPDDAVLSRFLIRRVEVED